MSYFSKTGFRKISLGFIVIITIALLNIVISAYVIHKNKKGTIRITNQINPYIETLEDFNLLITESKMYSTNWVYLPNSTEDKESLENIHSVKYPRIKNKLIGQLKELNKEEDVENLKKIFDDLELLFLEEVKIMSILTRFEDYENPTTKFTAEELIESSILPQTREIQQNLKALILKNRNEASIMKDEMVASFNRLMTVLWVTSVSLFAVVLLASAYVSRAIKRPILMMKDIILKMGKGELPKERLPVAKDVVGEMVTAVNTLSESFSKTSMFANEIGRGNLSAEYKRLGEKDMLGNALINMRNSLKAYSENLEQQVKERTKEVVEKSEKLEVAYGEIRDSINYAKRIQEAILPSIELVKKAFPDSFVLYKPKDIVCGDFYWYAAEGDEAIIGAIDCTGHGVPGALMTVVGNSLLNQIVHIGNNYSPSDILIDLDKRLLETLQQQGNVNTNDGMDAALCKYNKKTKELVFAGAKRPLYIFRKDELIEVKGDKFPIGSFQYEQKKEFKEYRTKVEPGDIVYLFSDGYQDQFGGQSGKKFMIGQFRKLLTDIREKPMNEQHNILEKEIESWKGNSEQTDDILVIGIRF